MDKRKQGRNASRASLKDANDIERNADPSGERSMSTNEYLKRQKLENQEKMITSISNCSKIGRKNTYMVTLTARVDSAVTEVKLLRNGTGF